MISIVENTTVTEILNEASVIQNAVKRSRLESVIGKITKNIDYSMNLNQCVIFYIVSVIFVEKRLLNH